MNFDENQVSEIVPTRSAKTIQVPPSLQERDYFTTPIPPLEKELIVRELQRRLLPELPPLQDTHINAYNSAMQKLPHHTSDTILDTAIILQDAKSKCIDRISDCLQGDGDLPGVYSKTSAILSNTTEAPIHNAAAPSLKQWLKKLEPTSVISMYLNLREQIVQRNGLVTETNPTLANATGGSTNAILLGNTTQSANALFYVVKYICKNKVELNTCITAYEAAHKHVEEYPSVAKDTGSKKRTVQHIFTRVLNDLARSIEIHDTQVALQLLNMNPELQSDSYRYFGADYGANYYLSHCQDLQETTSNSQKSTHSDEECTDHSANIVANYSYYGKKEKKKKKR